MKLESITQQKADFSGFALLVIVVALLLHLIVIAESQAETSTPAWNFISSPDWFNRDIADLSGSIPEIPKAEGWDAHTGLNGISSQMEAAYNSVVGEMVFYDPELFVVTGDLINGRWFTGETLEMFDPTNRNRGDAINKAADIYYSWFLWLFNHNGIAKVLGAVGDHEIGDDDWPLGSEKSEHVQAMKQAFGRNMVDSLALPLKVNDADSRPYGTQFEYGSYAYQHKNLLLVSVDVFRQEHPNTKIHTMYGSVSPDVSGEHLVWLSSLLDAADEDSSIDHVIIQGHTPVLRPVRMQNTSGMMLVDREDSAFWHLLRQHDHSHGGKVLIYFCGEVHAVTISKDPDSDLVQMAHGNPPIPQTSEIPPIFQGQGNYVVYEVHPDHILAELRRFPLTADGNSVHWQPSRPVSPGISSVGASVNAGSLIIDTSGSTVSYSVSGDMELVDQQGLTIHFDFDQTTSSGNFSNSGSIGNDFYEGVAKGGVATIPGMFGSAIQLNGFTAYVESGRGNITEGEGRAVSAWIKSSYTGVQTLFGYGRDKSGSSLNGRFNFQLNNGRPQLNIGQGTSCYSAEAPNIADGLWHHAAIILSDQHNNSCVDISYSIDGVRYAASSVNASSKLTTAPWANIRIGAGAGGELGKYPADFFNGLIDDAAMWGSPLTDSKARSIVTAGRDNRLRYDSSAMQMLFDLFDLQQGSVEITDRRWIYAQGLNGNGGDVITLGNAIAIQMDTSGNGVMEEQLAGSIKLSKTATPETLPEPGGEVAFDITINNISETTSVTISKLHDNIHGNLKGVGSCSVPQTLLIGDSYTCSFKTTVMGQADYVETDVVVAEGVDEYGTIVRNSDKATVTISEIPTPRSRGCIPYVPNGKVYLICW